MWWPLRGVCLGAADAEVVQSAVAARGELAELVGGAVADGEDVRGGGGGDDSGQAGSWGQPQFEGLVKAFDLALGLRVPGVAVFPGDAQTGP